MAIVDNWGVRGGQVSLKLMSREAAGRLTRADRSRLLLGKVYKNFYEPMIS